MRIDEAWYDRHLRCVDDLDVRTRMGLAARDRAVAEFDYDKLAVRLAEALTIR